MYPLLSVNALSHEEEPMCGVMRTRWVMPSVFVDPRSARGSCR